MNENELISTNVCIFLKSLMYSCMWFHLRGTSVLLLAARRRWPCFSIGDILSRMQGPGTKADDKSTVVGWHNPNLCAKRKSCLA